MLVIFVIHCGFKLRTKGWLRDKKLEGLYTFPRYLEYVRLGSECLERVGVQKWIHLSKQVNTYFPPPRCVTSTLRGELKAFTPPWKSRSDRQKRCMTN